MKKGFTLIELIVAVTILVIITSVGTIAYSEVIQSTRDSKRKQDLTKLSQSLEIFKERTGRYPITGVDANGGIWYSSEPSDVRQNGPSNNGDWIPGLAASGLVGELPRDPLGEITDNAFCLSVNPNWRRSYLYRSDDGGHYKLIAHCSAENPTFDTTVPTDWSRNDSFFDPVRPRHAWAVYSSPVSRTY